jgi:trans-2,3-dihydro-3-hydroxyanthranilate isomerase
VTLTGPTPTMSEPVDPAPLLAAVSLTDADLAGPAARIGGSGISFCYLNVRPEAMARARPDLAAMALLPPDITGVYFFALDERPTAGRSPHEAPLQVRARMFAPDIGGEDPATGSAALGLGGWLVASGLTAAQGHTTYAITQGVEMGRRSELQCDVTVHDGEITRVTVSGRVAEVARGRIRIP